MTQTGKETAMRVLGSLSFVACVFIIVILHRYSKIYVKSLHKVIFYISICNALYSIGVIIGLPTNGTPQCFAQAFLTSAPPLSAIFWTTTIAYMAFSVIYGSIKVDVNSTTLLAFNFIVPTILTLLPLTTETYGSPDEVDWCFLKSRANDDFPAWTTVFWSIAAFYGWLFVALVVYLVLFCVTFRHIYRMRSTLRHSFTVNQLELLLFKLIWYPLVTFCTWLPTAIYDIDELEKTQNSNVAGNETAGYVSYLLASAYGLLICCAYFATNKDVRFILVEVLSGRGFPSDTIVEEFSTIGGRLVQPLRESEMTQNYLDNDNIVRPTDSTTVRPTGIFTVNRVTSATNNSAKWSHVSDYA